MDITTRENVNANGVASGKRSFRPGVIVFLLLITSLALNAFLGWRVLRLGESVNRLESKDQLAVGSMVPSIKARSLDGREGIIKFQGEERPTILYFFSPGCDSCERNVPNVKALAEQKVGEYRVLGISLSEDGLEQYVAEKGFKFPVYSGLGVEPTLAYKLGRVPQTTIVSSEGKVLANWHGPYDGSQRSAIESHFGLTFSR